MAAKRAIVATAWALGFASLVHAGTFSVTLSTIDSGPINANGSASISIPQFSVAGATLIGIDFAITGYGIVNYDLTNTARARGTNYTVNAAVTDALENPLCSPTCKPFQDIVSAQAASSVSGTLAAGGTTGNQKINLPNASNSAAGANALFAVFTGNGFVVTNIDSTDNTNLTSTGGTKTFVESASGGALLAVTYTYTLPSGTTPEPVSALLFGGGLTALAVIGRKRTSR